MNPNIGVILYTMGAHGIVVGDYDQCQCGESFAGADMPRVAHRAHVADRVWRALEQHLESQRQGASKEVPVAVGDPLADAIGTACEWMMVTHYVVCAAVIADDGEPVTVMLSSPGLPNWQKYGLMTYCAGSIAAQPTWTHGREF